MIDSGRDVIHKTRSEYLTYCNTSEEDRAMATGNMLKIGEDRPYSFRVNASRQTKRQTLTDIYLSQYFAFLQGAKK